MSGRRHVMRTACCQNPTWVFEGCSCERDLEDVIRSAGFSDVTVDRYRLHTPFLPFNTHIAGTGIA